MTLLSFVVEKIVAKPSTNQNVSPTKHTLQEMGNWSFDEDFLENTVEIVGFDPVSKTLKRISTNALGEYGINDTEDVGVITYIGKEDPGGSWYVQKIDSTSGSSIRYATILNNPTVPDYATAWPLRSSTLVYDTYGTAF